MSRLLVNLVKPATFVVSALCGSHAQSDGDATAHGSGSPKSIASILREI